MICQIFAHILWNECDIWDSLCSEMEMSWSKNGNSYIVCNSQTFYIQFFAIKNQTFRDHISIFRVWKSKIFISVMCGCSLNWEIVLWKWNCEIHELDLRRECDLDPASVQAATRLKLPLCLETSSVSNLILYNLVQHFPRDCIWKTVSEIT